MEKVYLINDCRTSENKALKSQTYAIQYSNHGNLLFQENYIDSKLVGKVIQNTTKLDHKILFKKYSKPGIYLTINEVETLGKYQLQRTYNYLDDFHFSWGNNDLFDENMELIAHEVIGDGLTEYHLTFKHYYDRKINSSDELFESTFDEKGNLFCLLFNNYHIDPTGQESIGFILEENDLKEVQKLTELSENLIQYYMLPDVIIPELLTD